jgi:FAD synthase
MRVLRWPGDKPEQAPRLAAVGAFDGLHRGHQRVAAGRDSMVSSRAW